MFIYRIWQQGSRTSQNLLISVQNCFKKKLKSVKKCWNFIKSAENVNKEKTRETFWKYRQTAGNLKLFDEKSCRTFQIAINGYRFNNTYHNYAETKKSLPKKFCFEN